MYMKKLRNSTDLNDTEAQRKCFGFSEYYLEQTVRLPYFHCISKCAAWSNEFVL